MNPCDRDPLPTEIATVPAPGDNLIFGLASSLVNSVTNDGPELLVRDRPVAVQLSSFFYPYSRLLVGSNHKVKRR